MSQFLNKSTRATLVKRGFAHMDLLAKWDQIVGPTLSKASSPERLNFSRHSNRDASLKVRVAPGFAPEFQQYEPLIIERINSFFGYRAVGRLQLIQAPLPIRKTPKKRSFPPPTPKQREEIEKAVADVKDDELKENLARLGASLIANRKKQTT